MEWYPSKPSVGQAALGAVALVALAAIPLYWSIDETDRGNQIFLWVIGGLLVLLAIVRVGVVLHLVLSQRSKV